MRLVVLALLFVNTGCIIVARQQSVTEKEIHAAASMSFDSSRVPALKAIAARPGLLPHEQAYLVRKVYREVDFSSGKIEVLETLIHNPAFSPAAKSAILDGLDDLTFDSERSQIMEALNRRALSST